MGMSFGQLYPEATTLYPQGTGQKENRHMPSKAGVIWGRFLLSIIPGDRDGRPEWAWPSQGLKYLGYLIP